MSVAPKRITRSQSKRKIADSSQPTIAEAFAKKRNPAPAEPQTTDTRGPPQPAEPVIEVITPPLTPAPVPEPELVPDIVVEEEPRPTTTKVAGTKQPDGSKPTKVFPLFGRPKPPVTTQTPPEDVTQIHPPSQPTDFARSDETFLQALEASKPPPTKSRIRKWKSTPSKNGKSSGLSVEDPIILDLSSTRTRSLPVKNKLFDSRTPFKLKNKQGFGSLDAPLPTGETQHIRGPQTAFDKNGADIPFERRTRDPIASTSAEGLSTSPLGGVVTYPQQPPNPYIQCPSPPPHPPPFEIPAEYLNQHPAFQVFSEMADPSDIREPTTDLWVGKWRPCMAEQVLGNEGHALYLRDWLKASEINSFSGSVDPSAASTPASSQLKKKPPAKRGAKRPRIRREVGSKKVKKRRRRENDWIVDDDQASLSESSEPESHPLDACLDDAPSSDAPVFDEFPPEMEVPIVDLPPLAHDQPNAFDMSNTIVLCGPSGSGKTAAVFACAAELGWEVFEVYPGVGKRSGAALDNLIGQVGRNHLVTMQGGRQLSPAPHKDNALTRFLGVSTAPIPTEPGLVDGSSDGTDIPDIGGIEIVSDDGLGVPAKPPQDDPPPVTESVQKLQAQAKQSLVLLEEVDILYRDDINFWPTVTNIIRGCRRPVVLTCNDINLLPLDQLPVQKILSFTRPSTPIATAYLSAICRAEGTQPDECFFSTLRTGPAVDLRGCINQCQLGTSLRSAGITHLQETTRGNWGGVLEKRAHLPQWVSPPRDELQHKALFRSLAKHTDNISYLDSRLVLRVDSDWSNPTLMDDELGYKILPTGDLTPPEFIHYHQDIEVAEEILSLTSRLFTRTHSLSDALATGPENLGGSSSGTGFTLENFQLDLTSSNHRLWMNQLANDLAVVPPFDQRLFLEYESVVREMVVADDYVEACIAAAQEAEAAQAGQSGRQTRNSQKLRAGYYRYLDLEPDRKGWLVGRAFGGWAT